MNRDRKMMKTRNDPHSPSNLVLDDYKYIGPMYQGGGTSDEIADMVDAFCDSWGGQFDAHDKLRERPFAGGNWDTRRTCDHCGARFNYGLVYRHEPTNDHICVGHTCAANTMELGSEVNRQIKQLRDAAAEARRFTKRQAAMDWLIWVAPWMAVIRKPAINRRPEIANDFLQDLCTKFYKFGSLSERQVQAAQVALWRDVWNNLFVEPVGEPVPVTDKRILVRGVVQGIKTVEGYYGWETKMLLRDERGFKVWGTVPSSLAVERGDTVEFMARIDRSKDDQFFGFFKRPTKARNLTEEQTEEV